MRNRRSTTSLSNISEQENGFTIEMALPGYDKEDIHIRIEDNVLTIKAEQEHDKEGYTYREFDYRKVNRSFKLSKAIDKDKISASMQHGILTIQLAKVAEATPKTITIA
jgi:HSP20 family protein